VTLLVAAGIGTFWKDIWHSPWYARVLWIFTALVLLGIIATNGPEILQRLKQPETANSVNATAINMAEGAQVSGVVSGIHMEVGTGYQRIGFWNARSKRPTPEYLSRLKERITSVCEELLIAFHDPARELERTQTSREGSVEEIRRLTSQDEQEWRRLLPKVVSVYEDARRGGFSDEELDRKVKNPMFVLQDDIRLRLAVLAESIDPEFHGKRHRFRRKHSASR
jgi:hypothetical protein